MLSGDPLNPVVPPPHFHTSDEYVEVRAGTFLVGMGDKLDARNTIALGPYILTYVHPGDEPWGVFPYGY